MTCLQCEYAGFQEGCPTPMIREIMLKENWDCAFFVDKMEKYKDIKIDRISETGTGQF